MLKRGARTCTRIYRGTSRKRLLIRGHLAVFRDPDYSLPQLEFEMVEDSAGSWFQVSFVSPSLLTGSASSGWTWTNASHQLAVQIEQSTDLQSWTLGAFVDAAGSPAAVVGGYRYTARAVVPSRWKNVMCDLALTSNRGGKSITSIQVKGSHVALPGYPYAMPAAAATLQTHLRAAGYPGATVTSVAAPWSVNIRNHLQAGSSNLQTTIVGSAVTQVRSYVGGVWTPVSLPGYPYALPSAQATLQTHLRSAGFVGAVVKLLGPEWTIHLPNVLASATNRLFMVEFTPPDPFPYWSFDGVYQGLAADAMAVGTSGNVRTPAGDPLAEASRQFARLRITRTAP